MGRGKRRSGLARAILGPSRSEKVFEGLIAGVIEDTCEYHDNQGERCGAPTTHFSTIEVGELTLSVGLCRTHYQKTGPLRHNPTTEFADHLRWADDGKGDDFYLWHNFDITRFGGEKRQLVEAALGKRFGKTYSEYRAERDEARRLDEESRLQALTAAARERYEEDSPAARWDDLEQARLDELVATELQRQEASYSSRSASNDWVLRGSRNDV